MNSFKATLQSFAALLPVAFVALAPLGCVDPGARFDEFEDRVPDAGSPDLPDAPPLDELPDVNGTWMVSIAPSIAPNVTMDLYWDVDLQFMPDGTGMLTVTSTAISTEPNGRTLVGDAVTVTSVPVNKSGEFALPFDQLRVPGAANALTGSDLMVNVTLNGLIRGEDSFCGVLAQGSAVITPVMVDISGSTFGAVRVADGAEGTDLPAPLAACPDGGENN